MIISPTHPAPTYTNTSDIYANIANKIALLQKSILAEHPSMPHILREIHQELKQDPALVTLLQDEEIAIIVSGLMKQTNTILAATVTKSKSNAAALKKITADDLGF